MDNSLAEFRLQFAVGNIHVVKLPSEGSLTVLHVFTSL
jgi:hypothetical protein